MGLTISKLIDIIFAKKEARILMLGLDSAGKTTILYKLKLGEIVTTVPTIGFNVESVEYKNIMFTVWDVGGQDRIRQLWRHYYENNHGVIFVMDSSDRERVNETKVELDRLLNNEELRNVPFLIFANKQDLSSMHVADLVERLGMNDLKDKDWFIQPTCAITGDGLYEGLDWLANTVKKKK